MIYAPGQYQRVWLEFLQATHMRDKQNEQAEKKGDNINEKVQNTEECFMEDYQIQDIMKKFTFVQIQEHFTSDKVNVE